ncbi:hypothetical protein [Methanobrevibacter sp. DSM 116169]|uniref:hypothetical protein n=1 Tax=Methanobrevibacter sp. DSM 116169 TaxID=3242727 RepID=UPI0038FC38B3
MTSNNIDNIVIFKKELGRQLEIDQKYVGIKTTENNIFKVNLRVPENLKDEVLDYFKKFQIAEPISFDIGNTGDINCLFRGTSPVIENDDNGTKYYLISVILEEVKKVLPDETEGHTCSNCGLH